MRRAPRQAALHTKQQAAFETDGFLILPHFFSAAEIAAVRADIAATKAARPYDVVVDDLQTGARTVLGLMDPASIESTRLKLNDLYLTSPVIRAQALDTRLVRILAALLGHPPALCNSLYLEKGSAQDAHVDALYMTPKTPFHLIASWVALEDSHPQAGPLEYFPGSHRIPQYRFSNGGSHVIAAEMPLWEQYIAHAVAERGLPKFSFSARRGDVFIWHAYLLHAGGPIADPALTRRSNVYHYFSESDARADSAALESCAGAWWINRPAQALPPEVARQLPFHEARYLARNPDVAEAVRAGIFTNGRAHYDHFGQLEGRLPC